jgi:hypothetical protein
MRTLGRYLRLKACVDVSEQRYDDAIESLRMGYQMGHDTASEPLLINGLVGVAIASMMNSEVEGWIGSPDSPNLYWAIAAIPQPLVDLRPALEQESRLPEMMFPFLKDADTAQRTTEEWQRILSQSVAQLHVIAGNLQEQNPFNEFTAGLASTAIVMRAYPVAKLELEKSGYDMETLEKMPTGQVVAIYMQQVVRYIGDEMEKGAYLSPKQREEYYATLDQRLIREGYLGPGGGTKEPIPIASLLMPAVSRALSAQSRLERDFAAFQTLEAIRAHLSATGQFPDKLADIAALPVPANPLTEQPFEYRREGAKAILVVPPVSKRDPANTGKRYELQKAK